MKAEDVRKKLYEKYIQPTKGNKKEYIGVEIEIPILRLDKKPVDFRVVHEITDDFMREFSFEITGRDDEGNVYAAIDKDTGDIFSYDCSYNNLELSLGKEKELFAIDERFRKYYSFLQEAFQKKGHMLTGMGVNPYRKYNKLEPIPNGRYRMLYNHLCSYTDYDIPKYFHKYTEYGMFSSASQVQLDVSYENLIKTIRAFSMLEPVKAILFSNSVLLGEREELMCCRDMFWEDSTHGINPHNIGMFEKIPETMEELEAYIESTSIYCVEREEKYINFEPVTIMEYFERDVVQGQYYDVEEGCHKSISFHPRAEDIAYLRTFKFEDLTYRGTIEFRSCCCQPICDSMSVAAFHLGLKYKLDELDALLQEDRVLYGKGYTPAELRKQMVHAELPAFLDEEEVYQLAEKVVDLAREGLVQRGYGEESFLNPLYRRIGQRTNPARYTLENKENIEKVIREFS